MYSAVSVWCSVCICMVQCLYGAVSVCVWCSVCICLTQYQCTSDPAFVYVPLNKCDAVRRPLCTVRNSELFFLCTVCGFCVHFSGVHTSKQYRQCTYVSSNIGARSRNHFCSRKAVSATYSQCVSVALVIQFSNRMRRILLSSVGCLSDCTSPLPPITSLTARFSGKKLLIIKCVFLFFPPKVFWNISRSKKNSAR